MIDFYTHPTWNGRRVAIMLEETGLAYQLHPINLAKGAHKQAAFLEINPSGRIPAIRDQTVNEGLIVTQSAAILVYLAEKSGLLLPTETVARAKVLEWLFFHATDITPTQFDSFFLTARCEPTQLDAAAFLNQRIFDLYAHFDAQLGKSEFIGGDDYSIADIAIFPAINKEDNTLFDAYPHLKRWYAQVAERAGVQRGMKVGTG
ncbi:MAG: glutathione S-transferase N-terminal domain-containing protein [Methylococcales bacterium]|nr:glutathione S-transferase N-terminal domain-containing protein [Methylococcales bacterium]